MIKKYYGNYCIFLMTYEVQWKKKKRGEGVDTTYFLWVVALQDKVKEWTELGEWLYHFY